MQALLQPLSKLGEYEEIKNRIEKNRGILQLAGCIDSQKAHVIYGLGQEKKNRLVIAEIKSKRVVRRFEILLSGCFLLSGEGFNFL